MRSRTLFALTIGCAAAVPLGLYADDSGYGRDRDAVTQDRPTTNQIIPDTRPADALTATPPAGSDTMNAPSASSGSSGPRAVPPGPTPDSGLSSGQYSGSASGAGSKSLGRYSIDPGRH